MKIATSSLRHNLGSLLVVLVIGSASGLLGQRFSDGEAIDEHSLAARILSLDAIPEFSEIAYEVHTVIIFGLPYRGTCLISGR